MAKKNLLLVDQDPKSRRVLEVSLRKAGFIVTTATNGSDALEKVATSPPDLIISDTRMAVMDGFEFCQRLKENPEWAGIPFIFLTNQKNVEDKIRGLELGVEDYLTKPIYIKEIITRVKILLQRKEREDLETKDSKTRFEGTLADMTVVDLIQTVEIGHKTGVLRFENPNGQQGAIFLRNGQIIDADVGRLQGEQAVYRLLTWSEGRFEVEFRPIHRKQVIDMSPQALLLEGMRRVDEWGRLNEQLPSMEAVFEVDYRELAERLAGLPDEVNSVLKLFDGRRTLLQVLDHSEYDDLETLNIISKLYFEGLIYDATQASPAADSTDAPPLEGWLRDPEAAAAALGTSPVAGQSGDSTGGRKRRNTKRGLGALKEPPPYSSLSAAVDADIAKAPRSPRHEQNFRKAPAGPVEADSTEGKPTSAREGKAVTPAWAATSWSKHRALGQQSVKKGDLWQDDTNPAVPSRLASGHGLDAASTRDGHDGPVEAGAAQPAPSSSQSLGSSLAEGGQEPPVAQPSQKASPDAELAQGRPGGQTPTSAFVSGALDEAHRASGQKPQFSGAGPSVVVGDNLSVAGQSRSGVIGQGRTAAPSGTFANSGHEDTVVVENGVGKPSHAVSGEIHSIQTNVPGSRDDQTRATDGQADGQGLPADQDARPSAVVEQASVATQEAGSAVTGDSDGHRAGDLVSSGDEIQSHASSLPAHTDMGQVADNGAEHGFFGEQDRQEEADDFSDLDWAEDEGPGKKKWVLLGLLALFVGGAVGFWWYTKADRYFLSPDKKVYGDKETARLTEGPKRPRIGQGRATPRPARDPRQTGVQPHVREPVRMRPVQPPREPRTMPTTSARPLSSQTGSPRQDATSQSGAAIARAIEDAKKLLAKRRYQRAIQILESTVPGNMAHQGPAGALLGKAYEKLAQRALDRNALSKVVEYGRKAIKADSSRASSWFFVGYALHEQGKKEEARIYLKQYLTLCPNCQFSRWARRYMK